MSEEKIKKEPPGSNRVFQNEAKISLRHFFIHINIVCKIGEYTIDDSWEIKVFVKRAKQNHDWKIKPKLFPVMFSLVATLYVSLVKISKKWLRYEGSCKQEK